MQQNNIFNNIINNIIYHFFHFFNIIINNHVMYFIRMYLIMNILYFIRRYILMNVFYFIRRYIIINIQNIYCIFLFFPNNRNNNRVNFPELVPELGALGHPMINENVENEDGK